MTGDEVVTTYGCRGTVSFWHPTKKFGRIVSDDHTGTVFFHVSAIRPLSPGLLPGTRVRFVEREEGGRLRAVLVRAIAGPTPLDADSDGDADVTRRDARRGDADGRRTLR